MKSHSLPQKANTDNIIFQLHEKLGENSPGLSELNTALLMLLEKLSNYKSIRLTAVKIINDDNDIPAQAFVFLEQSKGKLLYDVMMQAFENGFYPEFTRSLNRQHVLSCVLYIENVFCPVIIEIL